MTRQDETKMKFPLITEVEDISFRLKCAIQALHVVHDSAEEDGGANLEKHCNALYSVLYQLYGIQKELDRAVDQATADAAFMEAIEELEEA